MIKKQNNYKEKKLFFLKKKNKSLSKRKIFLYSNKNWLRKFNYNDLFLAVDEM